MMGDKHGEAQRDPTATVTVPRSEPKTGRARGTDVGTGCAARRQQGRLAGRQSRGSPAPSMGQHTDTTKGTSSLTHTEVQPCPASHTLGHAQPGHPGTLLPGLGTTSSVWPRAELGWEQRSLTSPILSKHPHGDHHVPRAEYTVSPRVSSAWAQPPCTHSPAPADTAPSAGKGSRELGAGSPHPSRVSSEAVLRLVWGGLAGSHILHTQMRRWLPGRRTWPGKG